MLSRLLAFTLCLSSMPVSAVDRVTVYLVPAGLLSRTALTADDVIENSTLQVTIKDRALMSALTEKLANHSCGFSSGGVIDTRAVIEILDGGVSRRYVADWVRIYSEETKLQPDCPSDWLWQGDTFFINNRPKNSKNPSGLTGLE